MKTVGSFVCFFVLIAGFIDTDGDLYNVLYVAAVLWVLLILIGVIRIMWKNKSFKAIWEYVGDYGVRKFINGTVNIYSLSDFCSVSLSPNWIPPSHYCSFLHVYCSVVFLHPTQLL